MKLPGVVGPEDGVQCLVGLVDVMPTLCTYLGLDCPSDLIGQDLLAQRQPTLHRVGGGRHRHATARSATTTGS
jgi:arylsulfatase A-like enzyme